MDLDEARRLLGVGSSADPRAVRTAFHRLLRRHHPDVNGDKPDVQTANATTARIIDAYRTLRTATPPPVAVAPPAPPPAPAPDVAAWSEGDTVIVAAPPGETWIALMEAAHGLGEVAYVDRSVALLEIVVEFIDYPVCSVVLTLQGRGDGTTHAFCTVEALGGDPEPPADRVAALVADRVAAVLA